MAALVAGVQYNLSSDSNFHENKSLIFVKLTDSAHRAIQNYLRNRSNINKSPTIQFLGNEGRLFFPSAKSNHDNFTFSLSGNQDIEGPQGGFECVQQTGPKNLESLGTLPCKMRIHANDDVYETTRHRMHIAEENNKNKCTRVLKPNEPIGKKVKIKGTVRGIPTPSNSNSNVANHNSRLSSTSKANSNCWSNNRSQQDAPKKHTDIKQKPLRERLIHLLALRPFKRPELYDRINREGIREKEKNIVTSVLKQIAFMRDNTYHLHRYVWNDVHEDWPFYTEQEKAMLKRRKPQNLTPPGSSDGSSSGSSQSPNSIHPGSPPAIRAPPPVQSGLKRPGYYRDGNDGLPAKKQRISHYRKPESDDSNSVRNNGKPASVNSTNSGYKPHLELQQQHQYPEYVQPECSDIASIESRTIASDCCLSPVKAYSEGRSKTERDGFKEQYNFESNYSLDRPYSAQSSNISKNSTIVNSFLSASGSRDLPDSKNIQDSEQIDYLTYYTTINNPEQRAQYKAEFNMYYKEYKKLYIQVLEISKQFSQLEEDLRGNSDIGNEKDCETIKHQILQEYGRTKCVNARFYYLHNKLGHIKKLVSEYDTQAQVACAALDDSQPVNQ